MIAAARVDVIRYAWRICPSLDRATAAALSLRRRRGRQPAKYLQDVELQQQAELVSEVPALLPLAVHDTHDPDLGRLDALAGRGQAVQAHGMGAHELELHPDFLTLREQLVYAVAPVRKCAGDVELGDAFGYAVVAQMLETEAPLAVVGREIGRASCRE